MTPDPKLPPLADMLREKVEQQRRIAGVAKSAGDRLEIEIVAASRALIYADLADALAPYDALIRQQEAAIEKAASCEEELSKCIEEQRQTIRQQEARIAEQALRIEVLQNSARERDAVVEDLEARIAELENENDAQTRAFCAIPMCDLKPEFFVYREWEAEAGIEFFSTAQEASDAADAAMELAREELAQNGMVDDPEIVYGRVYARCETSKGPAPEHSEHDEVWHFDFEPRLTAELEVVRLRTMVAELERERETFRTAFSVANDQAEHTASLLLPVEAELAKFRELAREAKVVFDGIDYGSMAGLTLERWVQRLAALHKEE